jgi:ATP-binding protein involved in chromosome partitioning
MSDAREQVLEVMQTVTVPETGEDVVHAGLVRALTVSDDVVHFVLDGTSQPDTDIAVLKARIESELTKLDWVSQIDALIAGPAPEGITDSIEPRALPGVDKIILVGSGKGGVGKSTVAANLARAFVARGLRTGLLDADLYGPSQPRIFGTDGRPVALEDTLIPITMEGVKLLSVGSMMAPGQALMWRGAVLHDTLARMIFNTRWAPLDVLLIDLPPGTGDVPLTILQQLQVTGAALISTPQDLSLEDVRRMIDLFQRTDTPVLGLVENMAVHVCAQCGATDHLFGPGLENFAREHDIPYLGALPLNRQISDANKDNGPSAKAAEINDLFDAIAVQLIS